jgi:hypothetical protein
MATADIIVMPSRAIALRGTGAAGIDVNEFVETNDFWMRGFLARNKNWPRTLQPAGRPGSPVAYHINEVTVPLANSSGAVSTPSSWEIWDGLAWVDITYDVMAKAVVAFGLTTAQITATLGAAPLTAASVLNAANLTGSVPSASLTAVPASSLTGAVALANGGTGASTAAGARTALGFPADAAGALTNDGSGNFSYAAAGAPMAAHTFKGNNTAAAGAPLDLSIAQMRAELLPANAAGALTNDGSGGLTWTASGGASYPQLTAV